jgi:hypothetical protein
MEWLYNPSTVPHKKTLSFMLGFLAALLSLSVRLMPEGYVAGIFLGAFVVLLLVLLLVRPSPFRELKFDRSRSGIFSISVLGYGLGALVYHYRAWLVWLWNDFREIDEPQEWILVSLFLLGVILGFFVVRNWSKNQQDFVTSLTAVLGAAFLSTILGAFPGVNNNSNQTNMNAVVGGGAPAAGNTSQANANQENGNRPNPSPATPPTSANPATVNATTATQPTTTPPTTNQPPTNQPPATQSPTNQPNASRAAAAAAASPPTNTNQANSNQATRTSTTAPPLGLNPVTTFAFYALGFTLSGILNLIAFSLLVAHYSRTESPTSRSVIDFLYGSDKAKAIDGYFLRNFEEDPNYARVNMIKALTAYRDLIKVEFAERMSRRKREQEPKLDYFELISIENRESKTSPQGSPPLDPTYQVMFRKLKEDEDIKAEMFRVAISMRWQDNLEYIVAPGEYKKSFPYHGSVAGMSLVVRKTILMDRDRFKAFRTSDYIQGRTPNEADQSRGLEKADYLSYVAVPMSSNYGKPEETGLGVLHLDTKLFACTMETLKKDFPELEPGQPDEEKREIYAVECKAKELDKFTLYANNLYEQRDDNITYLENMRDVIVPLLELYKRCRTGAT